MWYLERQNGKNKKMINGNLKCQKWKNHLNITYKIQWFLEEKYRKNIEKTG